MSFQRRLESRKILRSIRGYLLMETKVKDLTVEELQSLISDTIKSTLEDLIEDMFALSSDEYLQSIKEARKDYREGRIKYLEDE
jgi:hypothetical protein